ncbi:hypothetical protein [Jatrophihabitans sp.]|uniref:hypothetical protein n=1 Tax=Jatrophihabitans sp. TaxID=1932789 RepID=UPI002B93E5EF|nr:hypothetical protein [Jatrophihabitans sp.]
MKLPLIPAAALGLAVMAGCSSHSKANSSECRQISDDYYAVMQDAADHLATNPSGMSAAFDKAKVFQDKARAKGCPVPDVFKDSGLTGSPTP